MTSWTFGIEIEGVLRPHTLRLPINHAEYYMKLAAALRRRGLKSKADDLQGPYRKRADHYDKWWITRDGSLGTYNDAVALEAVSPILDIRGEWEAEIDAFWAAARAVFHIPDGNTKCGSHIHIAPGRSKCFKLETLKRMAYGIASYEPLLLQLLVPGTYLYSLYIYIAQGEIIDS
ncbi:hypothetical protein NQ176_g1814 [Zarea fungicola]|uniref:Uncharacterized protein n=1 Tax=Zarea fungicola TaxID=93591 RepID=A0ACC1NTI7_9HYPO|nr:hypothetical protein NQ176_g1814 [Lecanicillium fungicola]